MVTKPRKRYTVHTSAKVAPTVGKTATPTAARTDEHDDFDWNWCAAEWQVRLDELNAKRGQE